MRVTRSSTKREYRKKNLILVLVFAVALPAASIYLGYITTRYYIVPRLQWKEETVKPVGDSANKVPEKQDEAKEAPADEEVTQDVSANAMELENLDFYSIQVGNFTTKENAQILIKDLASKGFDGYIYEQGGFKVIAITLLEREAIDTLLPDIRTHYQDAYVVTTNIPVQSIKYAKEDMANITLLQQQNKNLFRIFKTLSASVKTGYSEANDSEKAKEVILKSIQDLKGIQDELSRMKFSQELEKLSKEICNVVGVMIESLEDANEANKIVLLQNALSRGVYGYLDFVISSKQ